jgi:hypothetical protein
VDAAARESEEEEVVCTASALTVLMNKFAPLSVSVSVSVSIFLFYRGQPRPA